MFYNVDILREYKYIYDSDDESYELMHCDKIRGNIGVDRTVIYASKLKMLFGVD